MTGEGDKDSGLVERSWVRTHRKGGRLTERPMLGHEVEARFLDRHGRLQHATGTVRRNEAGELVVESWTDNVRSETPVPRDASVDVKGR